MTPLTFTALLAIFVLFIFFLIGAHHFRRIDSYESFYLRKRTLTSREYASSFSASSTSLATVLIWFVTFSPSEGLAILYAPITYFMGAVLFTFLTPALQKANFFNEGTTLGAYMYKLYESRAVSISIASISAIGLICILLIELYIGASIFSIYVSADLPHAVPLGVLLIAVTVFLYTALGGFPGVVRSDKFQLALMLTLAVLAPVLLWLSPPTSTTISFSHFFPRDSFLFPPNLFSEGRFIISIPLFVNLLFVNCLYYPAQLRSWQMAAACESGSAMRGGLIRGGIVTVFLWTAFILFGILIGAHYPDGSVEFGQILLNLASTNSFVLSYVLFPLLFCASLAALVSTADSAIIPLAQTITDDYLPARYRTVPSSRLMIIVLLLVALLLYYVVFILFGYELFHVLFTLFGLLIILAPAILFAVFFPERARTRRGRSLALSSLWVGFAVMLLLSARATSLTEVLYSGPIGVLVSAAIMGLVFVERLHSQQGG